MSSISSPSKKKCAPQLVVVHIDESQQFMVDTREEKKNGPLYELLNSLYEAMDTAKPHTVLLPVLTGTCAAGVYAQFAATAFTYNEIPIATLGYTHFRSILSSLAVAPCKDFVDMVQFALGGHPRLFRVFVSLLSWH